MQSIAEVSGESPGIRFKPCHYKSPSAEQFVRQLITAVKQRSHGAILRTEGKAVATGERRLGDKSKANMPKLIGQKRLKLPPILAAWQKKTDHRLWMGKYVKASAWTNHADIRHPVSALTQTGAFCRMLAFTPSGSVGATFYRLDRAAVNWFITGKLYLQKKWKVPQVRLVSAVMM